MVSVLYPNANLISSPSVSSVSNELLNEFINKLSDDPVYDLSFRCNQATWTYDVNSDITYEANLSFTFDINRNPYIGLNIYEGYTIIDHMFFERFEATSGFVWEEIEIDNIASYGRNVNESLC